MSYRRKRRRCFLVGRLPKWVYFYGKQLGRLLWVIIAAITVYFGWRYTSVWDHRSWYGFEPYRVLMISGEVESTTPTIEVLSIWPDTLKSVSINIPPETIISAVGGYGNYRVAALMELGQIEGVGDRLIQDSIGHALGIPIHQVYVSKDADLKKASWSVMKQALTGQRSAVEVSAIIKLLRLVRDDTTEKRFFSDKNVLSQRVEADGTVGWYFEPALTDRMVLDTIKTIWREAAMLEVAVVNASGRPFMAASWSRLPRVAGFDVVSVTDQQERWDKTTIIFSDTETMNAATGKVLAHLFPQAEVMVGEVGKYRASTVIMIGNSSWLWLTDRTTYLGE